MTGTAVALHATVSAAVLVGVAVTWRVVRRDRQAGPEAGPRRWYHRPGWWWAVVVAAVYVNQVLFTVYALRVRHGDLSELARHVPAGWFALADNRFTVALAAHVPAPDLLSATALRIPSLLELPFGLLAYLTVVDWLDPGRYRQLSSPRVVASACAAYTVTFGLIEWDLHTRYTGQDLVLRALSGVLCAVVLPRLGRQGAIPRHARAPRSAAELIAFAVSAAALGYLVLAIYDTALLYSLGRVGQHLPGAAVACGALALARWAAARLRCRPDRPVGPGVDTLGTGLSWWLALFLVPALAIRYELGFGSWLVAAVAGLLITGLATAAALREVSRRLPTGRHRSPRRAWLLQLGAAGLAGLASAAAGLLSPATYPEARLLRAAALFAVAATLVCAGSDRLFQRRRPSPTA